MVIIDLETDVVVSRTKCVGGKCERVEKAICAGP
jgi:hypothetical protein